MNTLSKKRVDFFNKYQWLHDDNFAHWIVKFLKPLGASICDFGIGDGFMLNYYTQNFNKVGAIEPNSFFLDNLLGKYKGVKILNNFAEKVSFKDKSYDICIAKSSLHHFDNVENGLGEMVRIAKKAIAIIEVISPSTVCIPFAQRILSLKEPERKSSMTFTSSKLTSLIEKYSINYRNLIYDQYIVVDDWLKYGDVSKGRAKLIYEYIYSQPLKIKKDMQIHFYKNKLKMLRRMNLVIGILNE